jgi:hypothetical protein
MKDFLLGMIVMLAPGLLVYLMFPFVGWSIISALFAMIWHIVDLKSNGIKEVWNKSSIWSWVLFVATPIFFALPISVLCTLLIGEQNTFFLSLCVMIAYSPIIYLSLVKLAPHIKEIKSSSVGSAFWISMFFSTYGIMWGLKENELSKWQVCILYLCIIVGFVGTQLMKENKK